MRHALLAAALALTACTSAPPPQPAPITLTGAITRADHQTYRELPFTVPPGTTRIRIDFTYDKDNRTVIDLGLRDPQGLRGWSGGNKSHIEIGADSATPSYAPGRIQPGTWKLILGIPNIRDGQTSAYKADITFLTAPATAAAPIAYAPPTLAADPGWRRGDFHTHTAHSDGSCDIDGARTPCPSMFTLEAAGAASLDFIAITDHNTISQLADIHAQQESFDTILLIPGTEITTFNGHANVIGNTGFLDFQLGSPRLPTLAPLLDQVQQQNAFISVNHPSLPSGEICMGCGWTVKDTDWSRITAVEVANGSVLRNGSPAAGLRFWDDLLQQGYRLTAIGGSDNHDATDYAGEKQSPIGNTTTAVFSSELSTKAIIEGVRSGRVFIDIANTPGATLDLAAHAGPQTANMGGSVALGPGEAVTVDMLTSGLPEGAAITLIGYNIAIDGLGTVRLDQAPKQVHVTLRPGAASGYIRPEIRDRNRIILMIGNPLYLTAR